MVIGGGMHSGLALAMAHVLLMRGSTVLCVAMEETRGEEKAMEALADIVKTHSRPIPAPEFKAYEKSCYYEPKDNAPFYEKFIPKRGHKQRKPRKH